MDQKLFNLVQDFYSYTLAIKSIAIAHTVTSAFYQEVNNGEEELLNSRIQFLKEKGLQITNNNGYYFVYEDQEKLDNFEAIDQPEINSIEVEQVIHRLFKKYKN
ncbi:hypothetical protein [Acinetobacter bereziniae]|uniref:hypothetical protein n=1 Tax=Acinetobacter bereziniae TaxID=106648 RepID=UPI00125FFFB6|nr:hypothetical protein [Acinetobacter bereziniae]